MKKSKKKFIIIVLVIVIVGLIFGGTVYFFRDKDKINFNEKNWINSNSKNLYNVNVINNISIFGDNGEGVFYSFLQDFSKETSIEVNPVVVNTKKNDADLSFNITKYIPANSLVFYKDHYVLLSNKNNVITSSDNLTNKKVGVIKSDLDYVSKRITNEHINYVTYKNKEELLESFNSNDKEKQINYIIVPLNEYIDEILSQDLNIAYHFGDIKKYYTLKLSGDRTFSSIITKFYNKWMNSDFKNYYNEYNKALFLDNLNIESKDIDLLTKKTYNYGFIKNSPYELIKGGNYGGIVSEYLKDFNDFSGVDFRYNEYKNQKNLEKTINNGQIDLYFNYYTTPNNYENLDSLFNISYVIIAPKSNFEVINSISSLNSKQVYVLKNSILEQMLNKQKNITVKTYEKEKELLKLNKKDAIICLDKNTYNYYANKLNKYSVRYEDVIAQKYTFKLNGDATLYKLMNSYFKTLDPKVMTLKGVNNYEETYKKGTLLSHIAQYLLYILIFIFIVFIILYKFSKKVKIQKKIKKEDKIRFIDELTSLKNRNYLNENIAEWDKNTIYPQTIIIIDLNGVKDLNDKYGHTEGDKQIQAAANILIKTQLDNSDIIRSDGNEFIIYLVGYSERQVASYIRKLYKEFKTLPYENGASMGYSMIMDDLKLIDDAINEATIDMKKKKESVEEKKDEKDKKN